MRETSGEMELLEIMQVRWYLFVLSVAGLGRRRPPSAPPTHHPNTQTQTTTTKNAASESAPMTTTYLGVSPPVRSGNPLCRDRSWTRTAYSASHSNLEALRELDSEAPC